jgi:hypothetical protein
MTSTDPLESAVLKAIAEGQDGGEGAEPLRAPDPDDFSDEDWRDMEQAVHGELSSAASQAERVSLIKREKT